MSGWSTITIEADDTVEEQLPDLSEVETLSLLTERAEKALENGWVDDLSEALQELQERIEDLEVKTGEIDAEECVVEYIEDNYEFRGESALIPRDPPTFQPGYRGLASDDDKSRMYAEEIFEDCKFAKRVLIISANDTSDSGSGILYERSEPGATKAVKVDFKMGYEGARGRDVTGYFRDEYSINGTATPY